MNTAELDLAYLAGLWDGEGHIGLHYQKTRHSSQMFPMATLTNCNPLIIENARRILDGWQLAYFVRGKTPTNPKHRTAYVITMTGIKRVVRFLYLIEPYLVGKRTQAQYVLALCWSRLKLDAYYNHTPYSEMEMHLYHDIRALNADGHQSVTLNEFTPKATNYVAKMNSELRAKGAEFTETLNRLSDSKIGHHK